MKSLVHNAADQIHDANELDSLTHKEDEICDLQKKIKDKVFDDQQDIIQQLAELQDKLSELKDSISRIGFRHFSLEENIDFFSKKYDKKLHSFDEAFAKLELIEKQVSFLEQRGSNLMRRLKHFFRPRIGNLYQYEPRSFQIPQRYFDIPQLKKYPTVSIVTPSFNQGQFLERTILSVLSQKYPNLEYIIQDGDSKDDSVKVIQHYASSFKHWESIKDNGQSHALNRGFCHASGDIMAYLNSDDILMPGTLNYVVNFFNTHPEVDVVYGHRVLIDKNDHEIGRWVLPPHDSDVLRWADYVPQETLFWRRSIWEKIGGRIDEKFLFAMDWDMISRFADVGAKFVRLPRFLGAFRIHSCQKTSAQISKDGLAEMERLRVRQHGRLVAPHEISKNIRSYLIKHVIYNKLYRLGILRY